MIKTSSVTASAATTTEDTMTATNKKENHSGNDDSSNNIIIKKLYKIILMYPELTQIEEERMKTPYHVSGWIDYMEILEDTFNNNKDNNIREKSKKKEKVITVLGRRIIISSPSSSFEMIKNDIFNLYLWVGRRALEYLPGSYKLWKKFLSFQIQYYKTENNKEGDYLSKEVLFLRQSIITTFESSLRRCHRMPRLWMDYLEFYQTYCLTFDDDSDAYTNTSDTNAITVWRRLLNRALESLPATQHDKIWNGCIVSYLERIINNNNNSSTDGNTFFPSETVLSILRRYCQFNPLYRNKLAHMCASNSLHRPAEAALLYLEVLEDPFTPSTQKHDLWIQFSDLVCQYPSKCIDVGIDFDVLVRGALLQQQQQQEQYNTAFDNYDVLNNDRGNGEKNDDESSGSVVVAAADNKTTTTTTNNITTASLGEMEGTLWTKLATYHTRLGNFDMARSIYEEAMEQHVTKVRDFSILFDAYTQFEEGVLEILVANYNNEQENDNDDDDNDNEQDHNANNSNDDDDNKDVYDDLDILLDNTTNNINNNHEGSNNKNEGKNDNASSSLEFAIARAEHLTNRRPLLLNHVLLKQNPHNVGEWLYRAELYNFSRKIMAIKTLQEALTKIQSNKAVNGSPSEIVLQLAKLYEEEDNNNNKDDILMRVRNFYKKICINEDNNTLLLYEFSKMSDLASCWAGWIEFELRHEQWDEALSLARQAVITNKKQGARLNNNRKIKMMKQPLYQSLKLWDLLFDLEESLGTIQTTKDSYYHAMNLKVITPTHIMNFATFLQEKKYWEDSFAVMERSIDELFTSSGGSKANLLLWKFYLTAFLKRYNDGTKIERARELFERCYRELNDATDNKNNTNNNNGKDDDEMEDSITEIYLLHANFEEQYGLSTRALRVYKELCERALKKNAFMAYQLYATKTIQFLGVTAARDVYQEAITVIENNDVCCAKLCLEFAKLEAYQLNELDRARKIMTYGAQMANPTTHTNYWKEWHNLEVAHGNEETYREMLRIKRSVQTAFSITHTNNAADNDDATSNKIAPAMTPEEALRIIAQEEGVDLLEEQNVSLNKSKNTSIIEGFVPSTKKRSLEGVEERVVKLRKAVAASSTKATATVPGDDEEINIDDDSDEDDEVEEESTNTTPKVVQNVTTKQIPAAVFGGLAS